MLIGSAQNTLKGKQGHLGIITDHQFTLLQDGPGQSFTAKRLVNFLKWIKFNGIAKSITDSPTKQTT